MDDSPLSCSHAFADSFGQRRWSSGPCWLVSLHRTADCVVFAGPVRLLISPGGLVDTIRHNSPVRLGDTIIHDSPVRLGDTSRHDSPVRLGDTIRHDRPVRLGDTSRHDSPVRLGDTIRHNSPVRLGDTIRRISPVRLGDTILHDSPVRLVWPNTRGSLQALFAGRVYLCSIASNDISICKSNPV